MTTFKRGQEVWEFDPVRRGVVTSVQRGRVYILWDGHDESAGLPLARAQRFLSPSREEAELRQRVMLINTKVLATTLSRFELAALADFYEGKKLKL